MKPTLKDKMLANQIEYVMKKIGLVVKTTVDLDNSIFEEIAMGVNKYNGGSSDTFEATFTYFKPSGRYYAEGRGVVPSDLHNGLTRERIAPLNDGCMPGLSGTGTGFVVCIQIPEAFPVMLPASRLD